MEHAWIFYSGVGLKTPLKINKFLRLLYSAIETGSVILMSFKIYITNCHKYWKFFTIKWKLNHGKYTNSVLHCDINLETWRYMSMGNVI